MPSMKAPWQHAGAAGSSLWAALASAQTMTLADPTCNSLSIEHNSLFFIGHWVCAQ